ncbi:hypothetical protein LshimejAT787_0411660 [Lyophyllum shimeji]|uniref:CFEM domain-containing protein n=1 Tax=Lyophyllum shimeji TaxID=47721 RepID=A0A9P3PKS8_LYOSH|nr:hypothetical protein LshimejAT787_0411660 [Lyophyllum shimeji]
MARLPTLLALAPALALLLLVTGQDVASLPPCAKDCASTAATAVGCATTDAPCLCKTPNFRTATLQCAAKTCAKEDQSAASGVLASMCNSVTTTSSSSSSSSTTATPTTTNATPSPPITTRSGTPTPSSTFSVTPTSLPIASESSSLTGTSTTTSPTTAGGTTLSIIPPSTTVVLSTSTLGTIPTTNAAAAAGAGVCVGGAERMGTAGTSSSAAIGLVLDLLVWISSESSCIMIVALSFVLGLADAFNEFESSTQIIIVVAVSRSSKSSI